MAETPRCYLPATGGGFAGSDLFKNVSKLGLDGKIDDGEDVGLLVHGTAPCRLPAPIRRPAHYEPIEGAPQMDSDSNPFAHDMQLQHVHDIKRWLKRQRRFFRSRAEQSRAWLARRDGSQGAAGPCKRIDPKTGAVIEILEGPIIVT
jgi:hypothetical protein